MRLLRKPCVSPAQNASLFALQTWIVQSSTPGTAPEIRNVGSDLCLAMQLGTTDWHRGGAADRNEWDALITVRHQPDTCVACVSSKGQGGVRWPQCQLGDNPHVTRCLGRLDPSRLAWEYRYPGGKKILCPEQGNYCDCGGDCITNPSACACPDARACCLASAPLSTMMCQTTGVPSAGSMRSVLPPNVGCSALGTDTCCLKLDNSVDHRDQVCMLPKLSAFSDGSTCQALGWVMANDRMNLGSCKDAGGLSFPCRALADRWSGLCLTAVNTPWSGTQLSFQQCSTNETKQVGHPFAKTRFSYSHTHMFPLSHPLCRCGFMIH
jgi:hypothetical protein